MRYIFCAAIVAILSTQPALAAPPDVQRLEEQYQPTIRPLLARYCDECHNRETAEAEVDLTAFATWADVRKQPETWLKVREMLTSGQMPPKDSPQPTAAEREQLTRWVHGFLKHEAQSRAGDPGRVVLRRLSNAEYTYTLRDLTGLPTLNPAEEFPVDGAAGEGFSNAGAALVMSPALVTKYLDAGKSVASHAVLLPTGFRFSQHTTRQDWANEALDKIRAFYAQYTDSTPGETVNLQGVVFNTNGGGRLPLDRYLVATLAEREALAAGRKTIEQVAAERQLSAKYLQTLYAALTSKEPSLLLAPLRTRWASAKPEDAPALVADIAAWQNRLWRFTSVGHIGKVGGPKRWMETASPLVAQQQLQLKLEPTDSDATTVRLILSDAGDGTERDVVVLQQPRLVAAGRPDILLRDLRQVAGKRIARRKLILENTAKYLLAADEAAAARGEAKVAELASKHGLDADALAAWLDYLGVGSTNTVQLEGHFTTKLKDDNYDFIQGWGHRDTPLVLANSTDEHVRVPGNMKPHGVAVHPSKTHRVAVGWRSPITSTVKVEGLVVHAHPECGNGVEWSLELRRGVTRQRLASGVAHGARQAPIGPFESLNVQQGDVLSILVAPRGGNHSCDLTAVDLKLTDLADADRTWDLAADVSSDITAANPHDDRLGNKEVWHFYVEPDKTETSPTVPAGSLLARWRNAPPEERAQLAAEIQTLLTGPLPADKQSPDAALHRQLASLSSPLLATSQNASPDAAPPSDWGLDPALFGVAPEGETIAADSLRLQAPQTLEIRLPTELVAGYELVATVAPHENHRDHASVQAQLTTGDAQAPTAGAIPGLSIIAADNSKAHERLTAELQAFRDLFPPALCYTKIVPVDEVVTLTLYYREDDHLARLMLPPEQQAEIDRLWDELHYISQDALTRVDALEQLIEYATQDGRPQDFLPLREPFQAAAAAFQQRLIDTESQHLAALYEFASRAYRRPLRDEDKAELSALYRRLRSEELPHEEAFRLLLARILVSPAFLYKVETPVPGPRQGPVTDVELATRLSYFLWSSTPDDELRAVSQLPSNVDAAARLSHPETLKAQTRRMLADPKIRRLATEFACQWLHIYNFDQLDEKSEQTFPQFVELRGPMYEESIQFFTDLFQRNGSILEIIDSDYAFLNEPLARHYGIPNVQGDEWRRVDGVKQFGRGGILGQGATLARQSGASRTSPILRGNWISEVLLGERLPRPPAGVPPLPDEDPSSLTLTVRELTERHSSDPKCAVCHVRIDPLGFALEGFDAIGRRQERDAADRPLDTRAKLMDGTEFDGLAGLRDYLANQRRDAFVRQFCRKLLGYALGRSVQLSDEPLLDEMQSKLASEDYKIQTLVEMIVLSPQFREIRGAEMAQNE